MPELDRRDFLKLVGVGAGAAAAAGCSERVEHLIPYIVQSTDIVPGIATYFSSTCRECQAGCGLLVRTREGRPVKLEGNPEHPINQGSLCARGLASIGRTYHPDRFKGPMLRGADGKLAPATWDDAMRVLGEKLAAGAAGTVLLGGDPGPTAAQVLDQWVSAVGASGRVTYQPFSLESVHEAAKTVYGVDVEPVFDLSKADLVIAFGSDFLETGPSPTEHARQLAEARDVNGPNKGAARLVYVGPRLSMTASNADEWIPAKPGTEGILALAIARAALDAGLASPDRGAVAGLLEGHDAERAAARTGVAAETIRRLGKAVAQSKSTLALPPTAGLVGRRATATAAAVLLLDHLAGATGRTVLLPAARPGATRPSYREVLALVDSMKSGKVSVLLLHGGNPVHTMPPASGFVEALAKVPFVVSFASMKDETTEKAHLVLPDHTALESWGDASPRPGLRSLQQPTLRPLYDTRQMVDVLLAAGRALGEDKAAKLPAGDLRSILEASWTAGSFRDALAKGGAFDAMPTLGTPALASAAAKLEVVEPLLEGDGEYALIANPSPLLGDGSGANLPWLQEVPDPVAKITWQSWAEVSHATAEKLGVDVGDVIVVETSAGRLEVPVLPRGGIRDDVVAVAVGQGHTVGLFASAENDGRPGEARGVNVISVLPAATDETGGRAWFSTKAKLSKTEKTERFAFTQFTDNQRDRGLGQTVTLAALMAAAAAPATEAAPAEAPAEAPAAAPAAAHGGEAAAHGAHEGGEHEVLVPYDPANDASAKALHRWSLNVDLDRCTGCSACVAACYLENNIPVVGEDQVRWGRHMAWLRVERWVGDGVVEHDPGVRQRKDLEQLGKADIRHAPMMCQQCGSAPCEPVCPVIATYHNPEGLNGMVYNRCIGTRYCANNCPYKVRKFNWYNFQLKKWPEPMHLQLNPDVTVRVKGVMEKCTFCTHRVENARQAAKDERRAIRDGEVTTACAQACPTRAITFGNAKDPESQVVKKSQDPVRGYHALHVLNTRPAVTYLAKVDRGPVEG